MNKLVKNYHIYGLITYILLKLRLVNRISIPQIKHKIFVRKNTSDVPTFLEIFGKKGYDKIPLKTSPKVIIDLGANIGTAAIYFANKYPTSKIISIEPEESNFEMLKKNTENYNNIKILNNAISNIDNLSVKIEDKGFGKWGFMTSSLDKPSENSIKTISVDSIMKKYSISEIDILKIDIEGAEKELFESNYESWIPYTKCVIIELHDKMKPGSSKSFFKCISAYNFSFFTRGENVIMINEDLK